MLAALILSAAVACSPDTTPQPKTLFSGLPIKALHFDQGGGNGPIRGKQVGLIEARVSIAICRWPEYTLSAVAAGHLDVASTGQMEIAGVTYDQYMHATSAGYELQRRWRDSSVFHPLVGFGIGRMSVWNYSTSRGANGFQNYTYEDRAHSTYYAPSVGIEASLFKYMTMYAIVGARYAGDIHIAGLGPGDLSGAYSIVGVGLGKFR
jgi:hypothetical protein